MNRVTVSRLIFGKSKKYLRTATVLLVVSLVLVSTLLSFVENQYMQAQKDFIDNDSTHIIEVSLSVKNGESQYLRFSDGDRIGKALKQRLPTAEFTVINEYQFNFGIQDADGVDHFIYGLDESGSALLGPAKMQPDTVYSTKDSGSDLVLRIPVVKVEAGGFSSDRVVDLTLKRESGVSPANPFGLFEAEQDQLYVSSQTYKRIIEIAYGTEWTVFEEAFDGSNPYGIEAVRKIFVYVDDLGRVDQAAMAITALGYSVNYTLKAFDDFAGSMRSSFLVFALLVLVVFLGAAAYAVLSFNSCFAVQKKDMGILKHQGYSTADIKGIYSAGVNSLFLKVGVVSAIYTAAVGTVLLRAEFLLYLGINLTVIAVLLTAVNRIVVWAVLSAHAKKDVIELLKVDKEFE